MKVIFNIEPPHTPWDIRFSLFKVSIRIHPYYWLTSILLCSKASHDFSLVILCIGLVFLSILVHEFGHIFCQKHYGDRDNYIVFWAMGGLACGSINFRQLWPRVWILLWGPGAGFILGALTYGVGGILYGWGFPWGEFTRPLIDSETLFFMVWNLFWINLAWGAMNLIPVYPLDGGQILKAFADDRRKPEYWAFQISGYVGVAIFLLCLSAYFLFPSLAFFRDWFMGLMFLILGVNNFYNAWNIRRAIEAEGRNDPHEHRESWQQDPDWWKRGGR